MIEPISEDPTHVIELLSKQQILMRSMDEDLDSAIDTSIPKNISSRIFIQANHVGLRSTVVTLYSLMFNNEISRRVEHEIDGKHVLHFQG